MKIQISLLGLLVLYLFIGSLFLSWLRRSCVETIVIPCSDAPEEIQYWPWKINEHDVFWDANEKRIRPVFSEYSCQPPDNWGYTAARYKLTEDSVEMFSISKFRFPPYWWGHFYRPEVWLAIIFGSLWLWRVVRWFRERRKASLGPISTNP